MTPTEVRDRISVGGVALAADKFPDEWVERQIMIWTRKLNAHTGDAYVETETTATIATGCSRTLILPDVNVSDVTLEVDGTAVTLDTNQPALASGLVQYAGGFRSGQTAVATYTHVQPDEDLCEIGREACAKWIERIASLERSATVPDASRVFNEMGGSTVYVTPDPNADPPRLTGYREVDDLVNILPRYITPGIA